MRVKSRIGGKTVWPLRAGVCTVLMLLLLEFADYHMGNVGYGGGWRYFTSTTGYMLRPLECIFLIYQVKKDMKWRISLLIPWMIYCILLIINLPAHFIFYFDPSFHVGTIGVIRILVPGLYLVAVFVVSIFSIQEKEKSEIVLVCVLAVTILIATLFELINFFEWGRRIIINPCVSVCYVFYYLYLHMSAAKRDPLTGLLNRQSFYDDVAHKEKDITAVISIDMNDLKLINDNEGHVQGDEALITFASIFTRNRISGTRFYRVGGDEFLVLCFGISQEAVYTLIEKIRADVKKTRYSCAIGCSIQTNVSIDQMVEEADARMYEEKRSMKTTAVR